MNPNRVLRGNNGRVWLNGRLISTLSKIELKVTGSFEEMDFCGEQATHNVYTGWSGDGTVSIVKVDSETLTILAEAYKSGIMPDFKIITKLTDVTTGQSERVSVENIVFTEFMLAAFEKKAIVNRDFPLKFSEFKILERIAA